MKKTKNVESGARRSSRKKVLFVCVGNACRSPMAEAIARYDAADVIEAHSAGISPLGYIADLTKQILERNGYSANGLTSDALTPEAADATDVIINMTGMPMKDDFRENKKVEDWIVQDPFGADPETYQRVFDGIKRRVNQLAMGLREQREHKTTAR